MDGFKYIHSSDDLKGNLIEGQLVIVEFYRKHIEAGSMGEALDKVLPMIDDPSVTKALQGNVIFTVSGYDNDPRELYEIDPVKRYFKQLVKEWPFILHFLDQRTQSLGLIMTLIADDNDMTRLGDGRISTSVGFSDDILKRLLNECLNHNELHMFAENSKYLDYLTSRLKMFSG